MNLDEYEGQLQRREALGGCFASVFFGVLTIVLFIVGVVLEAYWYSWFGW